ncbi:S8 family serine peptidase [Priestia koreensis]|uniref:S8 family serine peptidase n=1 Tax=Priestia koreensis TaxID=284581 RepID=UPI0006AA004F|nr:S8 family serine peptidase [Priestia koreensis]
MKKFLLMIGVTLLFLFPFSNDFSFVGVPTVRAHSLLDGQNHDLIVSFTPSFHNHKALTNWKKKQRYDVISFNGAFAVSGAFEQKDIASFLENQNVVSIERDKKVHLLEQVMDWGVQAVHASYAWKSTYTGKGVKVAVLDTGIGPHEEVNVVKGVSMVSYTTSFRDDHGHGTHVAGIIAAKNNTRGTVGVAPNAELYAVKVLDSNGNGYLSDIIKGIMWAVNEQVDIINMSFGTSTPSQALEQAINIATQNGIQVVVAAGNSGSSKTPGLLYPAKYEPVIAVGSVDKDMNRSSFSSYGPELDVVAPGSSIQSTYLFNSYARLSGTSMAAPHVAGDLALLKEAFPNASAQELSQKLFTTAKDVGPLGKDDMYGYGLIQAPFNEGMTQLTVNLSQPSLLPNEPVAIKTNVNFLTLKPAPHVSLRYTVTMPSGKKISSTAESDDYGEATFTFSSTQAVGTYKVDVSSLGNGEKTSVSFMVPKPSSSHLHFFLSSPTLVKKGRGTTITASVLDAKNRPLSSKKISFTATTPSNQILHFSTISDKHGKAFITLEKDVPLDMSGVYSITGSTENFQHTLSLLVTDK